MLISFAFENFKSFREGATLSLVARRAEKSMNGALLSAKGALPPKDRLLPAVAIYGANASGKTNSLLALLYMRRAVHDSQTKWKSGAGTRFDPNVALVDAEGYFEAVIYAEGTKFRYGFRVKKSHFSEEWLYSYPKGRERLLFRRSTIVKTPDPKEQQPENARISDSEIEFGPHMTGDRRDNESSFRRTRENSLFLSSAAQDNQYDCMAVEKWFRKNIISMSMLNIDEDLQRGTSYLASEFESFKSLLLPLLRAADPCIKDIFVEKPENSSVDLDSDNSEKDIAKGYKVSFIIDGDGREQRIPFSSQSRGVKRMYMMASGLITGLKFGRVVIIDELEASMHAHVASQLLALFQNKSSNPRGAQLIFSTHETRLLNLKHLRRDQVWFCERDYSGDSTLFSLLEFSPRKDENFEVGYLRGRYGAVPHAGIDPSWLAAINDVDINISSENVDV